MKLLRALLVLVCVAAFAGDSARACSVPVFRYVLERFEPSAYRVVIFHRGPLTPEQLKLADALRALADSQANIEVELLDLAAPAAPEQPAAWKPPSETPLPWAVLAYPNGPLESPAWAGPLNAELLRGACDSPARREIAARLLKGDSAVFLLIESGQKEKDEAAAALLHTTLADMEKTLQLPEPDPDAPGQLIADLPLRIAFSSLRVSRTNPAENVLVQMLLRSDKEMEKEAGPIVVPVFGRGRALTHLAAANLNADTLKGVGEFLCGACTCTYKEQLPGMDLLIAADWSALGDGKAVREVPPALQGLASLAEAAAAAQTPSASPALPVPTRVVVGVHNPQVPLIGVLLIVLAAIAIAVVAATLVVKARNRERRG